MAQAKAAKRGLVDEHALYSKITWRLIPYLFLLYIVAYVDRVQCGFHALRWI